MKYLAAFRRHYLTMTLALLVLAGCAADTRAPGFLLDKKGQIVKRYMGEPDMKELTREIELRLRS